MPATILVVDDDIDVAETVARTLQRAGYETLIAYRGTDALQLARERHPAIVVLDIKMPGMTGIQVCRLLRATQELSRVPILFLSAKSEVDDRLRRL